MPPYTWSFLPGLVWLTSIRERNVLSHIFSSSFKSFRGLPLFVLKWIFTWYFLTNFSITSAFLCGLFDKSLSARNGAFAYCWMSYLGLRNIDQLLALQLLCFLCFVLCGIARWPYTVRISLDFSLIWHNITFYERHRFFSFVHFLYFCTTVDNPLYSHLLGRPKMIKMMSQTSIKYLLQPYVDIFLMMSSSETWRHFSLNCFSKWAWLAPTHPSFKEFFVKTFSMMKYYKSPNLIKIAQKFR